MKSSIRSGVKGGETPPESGELLVDEIKDIEDRYRRNGDAEELCTRIEVLASEIRNLYLDNELSTSRTVALATLAQDACDSARSGG